MTRRGRAQQPTSEAPGLLIEDDKAFGMAVAKSVRRLLHLQFTRPVFLQLPQGQSLRIATNPPVLRDEDGQFPVLILREPAAENDGVWLEVALDFKWLKSQCFVSHVSLKVYSGASPGSAALRFRGEWDHRMAARPHAQPHWNVEQQLDTPANLGADAPWVSDSSQAPWSETATAPAELHPSVNLSHFHFAMSASWQNDGASHSGSLADQDALVRWLTGCIAYIRDQVNTRRVLT